MKKITLLLFLLCVIFLYGCSDSNEVQILKEQNALLEKQIQQNRQEIQNQKVENQKTYTTNQYQSKTNKSINAWIINDDQETITQPIYKEYQNNNDSIDNLDNSHDDYDWDCCKYCTKWKACWDSCISRSYQCHKWPGCACNR
jgi:uncharacterized protein YcfL